MKTYINPKIKILILLLLTACSLITQPTAQVGQVGKGKETPIVNRTIPAITLTPTQSTTKPVISTFDGEQALQDVNTQVAMGPRTPESSGHEQIISWIQDEVGQYGWDVEVQETSRMSHRVQNIVAKRGEGHPWIILGAHYDTRMIADRDPDPQKSAQPVPGANDGASGVAVLLGLARVIPENLSKQVWLVFFDMEDNGNIPGWDWSLGSAAFVDGLEGIPDEVVIVDMVGDANLEIYKEMNSDPDITNSIWLKAGSLGYNQFNPSTKHSIIDDHIPFLRASIPAIDIIDIDYPYWHTSEDTPDKVSAESLDSVGETLLAWLTES